MVRWAAEVASVTEYEVPDSEVPEWVQWPDTVTPAEEASELWDIAQEWGQEWLWRWLLCDFDIDWHGSGYASWAGDSWLDDHGTSGAGDRWLDCNSTPGDGNRWPVGDASEGFTVFDANTEQGRPGPANAGLWDQQSPFTVFDATTGQERP